MARLTIARVYDSFVNGQFSGKGSGKLHFARVLVESGLEARWVPDLERPPA
jgi:hypothetical protein